MRFQTSIYSFTGLFAAVFLISCSAPETKNTAESVVATEPVTAPEAPAMPNGEMELKVLENPDRSWGYDIYIDGKMSIHQPIIPGLAGNTGFKSAEIAEKVGTLAMNKMANGAGLPTITIHELDSLGATK